MHRAAADRFDEVSRLLDGISTNGSARAVAAPAWWSSWPRSRRSLRTINSVLGGTDLGVGW
jgi:hypothetical protein